MDAPLPSASACGDITARRTRRPACHSAARAAIVALAIVFGVFIAPGAKAQAPGSPSFRTRNFVVYTRDVESAKTIALAAEKYRVSLAKTWLGKELPAWSRPCTVRVRLGTPGAGGWTKFDFSNGQVLNWRMQIQGSMERVLDSVLPHEINHTIFATHFRRPLPRWADEGAATLFEHESERRRQLHTLAQVIDNDRQRIPLKQLLSMEQYPEDERRMLTLYAEGYSLVEFLVQQGGRETYLQLLHDAPKIGWEKAITRHYDHQGIEALEKHWKSWFMAGSPRLDDTRDTVLAEYDAADPNTGMIANATTPPTRGTARQILREQRPTATSQAERTVGVRRSDTTQAAIPSPLKHISAPDPVEGPKTSSSLSNDSPFLDVTAREQAASQLAAGSASDDSSGRSMSRSFTDRTGTTHSASLAPTANITSKQPTSAGFRFSARSLPRERQPDTGGIPAWARFPRQQESF